MADKDKPESKILDPKTLHQLYWGDGTPATWSTCEQIAEEYDIAKEDVEEMLGLGVRTATQEALFTIWIILVDQWSMNPDKDFKYDKRIEDRNLHFYIVEEEIGITVSHSVGHREVKGSFSGTSMFFKVSPTDPEFLEEAVNKLLEQYKVKRRISMEREEGVDVW